MSCFFFFCASSAHRTRHEHALRDSCYGFATLLHRLLWRPCKMGQIPVRVTKNNLNRFFRFRLFLFKTKGLVYGINSLCELHGIAHRRMASRLAVYPPLPSVLIPYNAIGIDSILAEARFHAATSCGFHTSLRNDLGRIGEKRWQNAI